MTNAYSVWLVRDVIAAAALLINGDTVHPVDVERRLLAAQGAAPVLLAIDDDKHLGEEEMEVHLDDGRLTRINKALDPVNADGEYIGLTRFEPEAAGIDLGRDRLRLVGRLQLDGVLTDRALLGDGPTTVLYAPTWEGYFPAADDSSVATMGEALVEHLLTHHPDLRLVFKPHPLAADRAWMKRAVLGEHPDGPFATFTAALLASTRAAQQARSRTSNTFAYDEGPVPGTDGSRT